MGSVEADGMRLTQMLADVVELRDVLRSQGASRAAIQTATENIVRDAWEPLTRPIHEWPGYYQTPTCAYCDGTGLVMRFHVRNRLGVDVTEGEPCRCPRGARFQPPNNAPESYTSAGKMPKPKQLSRFGA